MQNRSLSNYRSTAKSVASATVFFVSTIATVSFSTGTFAQSEPLTLTQRVEHLEELNQTRNKVQADISFQLTQIQREVRLLTGQVEDNTFKLKQIQDRQRDLYRDIESRLSGLASKNAQSSNNTVTPKSQTNKATPSTAANTQVDSNANKDFEEAFALVRNKNYSASITAFKEFLNKHPNSNYSDNARYWMGQVYLVQGELSEAEQQFSLLLSEYPQSAKTAAAQLKLGDIYVKQQKWDAAKAQYTAVASSSSGSSQQLARKGLDKIKQAGH